MKRWILVLAVLLGGAVSCLQADYIRIIVNLGGSRDTAQGGNQPGQPGGPGGDTSGGGETGRQPGGRMNIPGAPGVGRTAPGGEGFSPEGGTAPGGPPLEEIELSTLYAQAVVEVETKHVKFMRTTGRSQIQHKWGPKDVGFTSFFIPPDAQRQITANVETYRTRDFIVTFMRNTRSVAQRWEDRKTKMISSKEDKKNPGSWLTEAEWALAHGLVGEVPALLKNVAQLAPQHAAALAFTKVAAALANPASGDPGEALKERLGGEFKSKSSDHYTLLYDVPTESQADSCLKRLEENFQAFYYWWALRGRALPVPGQRLVAVLVEAGDNGDVFDAFHKNIFSEVPLTSDGFYARRENVTFISSKRLDAAYEGMTRRTRPLWQTYRREELLAGGGFPRQMRDQLTGGQFLATAEGQRAMREVSDAQVMALLMKVMQDDAERATVTHEGSRQLIAAAGLLPRNLAVPQWVDNGMGSFFETAKGAFWPGTGGPNWTYLPLFKHWVRDKARPDRDKDPVEALKGIVTDRYFREADAMAATDVNKDRDTTQARMLAWSLTYYLTQKRLDHLVRYHKDELSAMPRDLHLDETTLLLAFARAFDLVTPNNPDQIDANRLGALARDWQDVVRRAELGTSEVTREVSRAMETAPKPGSPEKPAPPKP